MLIIRSLVVGLCIGFLSVSAQAQGFNHWSEFANWCSSTGGNPLPNPPRCIPRQLAPVPTAPSQAAVERKRNAGAAEQQGLEAESRGDLKEAAIRLMEALEFEPDSPEIHAQLDRVNAKLADEGDANEIRELRLRIEDSISAATIRVQRHQMEEMLAKRQARVAIVSGDCIFDGRPGCTDPVALVQVGAGKPPVPADTALFIEKIPESVRTRPEVKQDIDLYEHMASVRGVIQNQMIADRAVAKAHPGDQRDKLKLIEDSGHLKVAVTDEQAVKKRLSMSIGLILQSAASEQR